MTPEHEAGRRRKLAETWVKRALEHNRLGDRPAALGCLATSVRVWPPLLLRTPGALLRRRRGTAESSRSGRR